MTLDIIEESKRLEDSGAGEILDWTFEHFDASKVKMSTSFGADGMALLHMMHSRGHRPKIFTIDTGRLFQETYNVWQKVIDQYGVKIEVYGPDPADLHELVESGGPNMFYQSVENRRKCCEIRKVRPLNKALQDTDVWITALRRDQAPSRATTPILSHSSQYDLLKVCPLVNWSEVNAWEYIRNNGIPYNELHDKGYPTIGCSPCCRPVPPASDRRAGRWWWESGDDKECGIHIEDGKIVRKKKANFVI
ncbi:MAG: phosphoadenylyl-sulfate reductase [Planctomycetes bacterium]|nr:phosphoadenylyl-sulfate reductase [Planctomycetota bacterium]